MNFEQYGYNPANITSHDYRFNQHHHQGGRHMSPTASGYLVSAPPSAVVRSAEEGMPAVGSIMKSGPCDAWGTNSLLPPHPPLGHHYHSGPSVEGSASCGASSATSSSCWGGSSGGGAGYVRSAASTSPDEDGFFDGFGLAHVASSGAAARALSSAPFYSHTSPVQGSYPSRGAGGWRGLTSSAHPSSFSGASHSTHAYRSASYRAVVTADDDDDGYAASGGYSAASAGGGHHGGGAPAMPTVGHRNTAYCPPPPLTTVHAATAHARPHHRAPPCCHSSGDSLPQLIQPPCGATPSVVYGAPSHDDLLLGATGDAGGGAGGTLDSLGAIEAMLREHRRDGDGDVEGTNSSNRNNGGAGKRRRVEAAPGAEVVVAAPPPPLSSAEMLARDLASIARVRMGRCAWDGAAAVGGALLCPHNHIMVRMGVSSWPDATATAAGGTGEGEKVSKTGGTGKGRKKGQHGTSSKKQDGPGVNATLPPTLTCDTCTRHAILDPRLVVRAADIVAARTKEVAEAAAAAAAKKKGGGITKGGGGGGLPDAAAIVADMLDADALEYEVNDHYYFASSSSKGKRAAGVTENGGGDARAHGDWWQCSTCRVVTCPQCCAAVVATPALNVPYAHCTVCALSMRTAEGRTHTCEGGPQQLANADDVPAALCPLAAARSDDGEAEVKVKAEGDLTDAASACHSHSHSGIAAREETVAAFPPPAPPLISPPRMPCFQGHDLVVGSSLPPPSSGTTRPSASSACAVDALLAGLVPEQGEESLCVADESVSSSSSSSSSFPVPPSISPLSVVPSPPRPEASLLIVPRPAAAINSGSGPTTRSAPPRPPRQSSSSTARSSSARAPPLPPTAPPRACIAVSPFTHQLTIYEPPRGLQPSAVIADYLRGCEAKHRLLLGDSSAPSGEPQPRGHQGATVPLDPLHWMGAGLGFLGSGVAVPNKTDGGYLATTLGPVSASAAGGAPSSLHIAPPIYRCFPRMTSCATFVLQATSRAAADDALRALKKVRIQGTFPLSLSNVTRTA